MAAEKESPSPSAPKLEPGDWGLGGVNSKAEKAWQRIFITLERRSAGRRLSSLQVQNLLYPYAALGLPA